MNTIINNDSIEEKQARVIYGDNTIDELLSIDCDFTGRLIDDCYGVVEMSASLDLPNNNLLTVYYLVPTKDIDNYEDAGDYDYNNYYFVITNNHN